MKIRSGFVSNSSSSSFVIFKDKLTEEQINKIKDHYNISKMMCEQGTRIEYFYSYEDCWDINETNLTIEGYTPMDNFSMYSYLIEFLGVNPELIIWRD